jgi:hypothetical protein
MYYSHTPLSTCISGNLWGYIKSVSITLTEFSLRPTVSRFSYLFCFPLSSLLISTEQSPPSEATGRSRFSWNSNVRYRVNNIMPVDCIFSQRNPDHILTSSYCKIHLVLNSSLCPGLPRGLYPSSFRLKFSVYFSFLICVLHIPSNPSPLIWLFR